MGYTFVEPAGYGNRRFYDMEPAAFKLCVHRTVLVLSALIQGRHFLTVPAGTVLWPGGMPASMLMLQQEFNLLFSHLWEEKLTRALILLSCTVNILTLLVKNAMQKESGSVIITTTGSSAQLDGHTVYDFMLENTDPSR